MVVLIIIIIIIIIASTSVISINVYFYCRRYSFGEKNRGEKANLEKGQKKKSQNILTGP